MQTGEIGNSVAPRPVLSEFFSAHKGFHCSAFMTDSACDSYDNHSMLKIEASVSKTVSLL